MNAENKEYFDKLSDKAKDWLIKHHYDKKAIKPKEYSGRLEFSLRGTRQGFFELNVVCLSDGSWSFHQVPTSYLKYGWRE